MIADRIQVDNIPRIGLPRAEPTTFTYTGATALTPEQYQSQFVNYANQYIGLPSLEKETGISVTAPTVEEVQTGVQAREDDDDIPSFIKAGLATEDISFGIDSLVNTDTGYEFKNKGNFSTYADYLKGTGKADRVDIVENLYSPIMEGNFKDINLSEADLFSSLIDAPKELREDIKGLSKTFNEQGVKGVVEKYGEPVAKKVLSTATGVMMGPLAGAGLSGILGGEAETNVVTGKPSFRPAGILGAFYDLNATRQFQDVLHIRAVEQASLQAGNYFDTDVGFAMGIGNFGITRRPGANTYTGNRRGMSHKQIKDLEAISKGYLPESYRLTHDKDGQSSIFLSGDTKINQRISDDGGLMVDPNNPMAGFYKGDGTFYSPRFGYSKYGMRKDIQNLADKYGIDTTLAEQALKDARAGKGTLAGNIFKIKRDTADKDEKGESSFVPTSRPPVPAYPFQTTGSTSMDRIQQSIQDKKDKDDKDNKIKKKDEYSAIADTEAFNTGGFIERLAPGGGVRMAGTGSGFVDGVPPSQTTDAQEVADDRSGKLPEGAYVINASAVTFAGETDIINMLREAQEEAVRRGVTPENPKASSMIDVAVSRGEVVVAPYLVNIIGKDRLEKINNRGVKDTERKIEENGQQVQGAAKGDLIPVYRGEPLDPDRVGGKMDYGYGKEDVGKFYTPSVEKARRYTESPFLESGNRVIKSRKVTVDELFEGVKEAWKTQAKVKTDYFSKMPKSELKKNLDFLDTLKEEVKSGKGRSINDVAFFLQEQVFHDDKSKINFIETFKNDPKTAFKLAGRAITKIATKATPPIAFLEIALGAFATTPLADGTLRGNESFLTQ